MSDDTKKQIIKILEEEASRISYGKVVIEVLVKCGKCINIQFETKRSVNLLEDKV